MDLRHCPVDTPIGTQSSPIRYEFCFRLNQLHDPKIDMISELSNISESFFWPIAAACPLPFEYFQPVYDRLTFIRHDRLPIPGSRFPIRADTDDPQCLPVETELHGPVDPRRMRRYMPRSVDDKTHNDLSLPVVVDSVIGIAQIFIQET